MVAIDARGPPALPHKTMLGSAQHALTFPCQDGQKVAGASRRGTALPTTFPFCSQMEPQMYTHKRAHFHETLVAGLLNQGVDESSRLRSIATLTIAPGPGPGNCVPSRQGRVAPSCPCSSSWRRSLCIKRRVRLQHRRDLRLDRQAPSRPPPLISTADHARQATCSRRRGFVWLAILFVCGRADALLTALQVAFGTAPRRIYVGDQTNARVLAFQITNTSEDAVSVFAQDTVNGDATQQVCLKGVSHVGRGWRI